MDFRILGPLEVFDGAVRVPLGKPRERAVLAALLLHANEPLSRERVIDLVWGASPPRTADAAFYNCVSKLRQRLGADRLPGDGGAYRLVVGAGELDRDRVESLIAGGQAALDEGAPERAASMLGEALSMWRGDPFDDVRYEAFAQPEVNRLEELRVAALEARTEADLACGRHDLLVAELEGLVRTHPWRERFRAQLMLALYRCGRQADALDAYQDARKALGDELGLEPSAELQELERKILQQDPSLDRAEVGAPTDLPIPPTRLIGREQELDELHDLLQSEHARLLTLVGPGGVGKTRLALEVAAASSRRSVFVDLSPLSAPEQVLPTLAHALGVRETSGRSLAEATTARIRVLDHCLVVVDNCERVVAAAPELAALVASCPKLRMLVTSREPLHVAAERGYPVEPLSEESAVTLFVERGRRMQSSFAPDAAAAPLCRRLDGLPLALELAAARTNVLTTAQILERLERRDDLLTVGARDAPARQKTLHAAIDWSYDLLDEDEKRLFAELAVFAGSFSLEAAEAVCAADVDVLASLVDKSLVRRRGDRFAMLETIREYATGLLDESVEADDLRRRHAEHFLALVERDDLRTIPPQTAAIVVDEYDNLRAGLAWTTDAAHELAVRLAAALWAFWWGRSMLVEGRYWLERALQRGSHDPSSARANALSGASFIAYLLGDRANAERLGDDAIAVARAVGDPTSLVWALNVRGVASDDYETARRVYGEAASLARESHDDLGLAISVNNLGNFAGDAGDWTEALALYTESLALRGDAWPYQAVALCNVALAELQTGAAPKAVAHRYEEIIRIASVRGEILYAAGALHGLGLTVAAAGFPDAATRVLGAALAQHEALGVPLSTPERSVHEATVENLRSRLGDEEFASAWADGSRLKPDEAVSLALESIPLIATHHAV
jgi:predicted ATPase/DNA-binding SARP family transcriptional activator